MSDAKAVRSKADKQKTGHSADSPDSPVESSSLSTPVSDEDSQAVEDARIMDHMKMAEHTRSASDNGFPDPVDIGSASDESDPSFECPHCDKTYSNAKSLKRHINDKKSVCFKTREALDDGTRWSCPRCHSHMSKKYSVIRHIRDSCWKTCDECCESESVECDSLAKEGNCTTCKQAGHSCTKHTEPVADCVPMLMTGALAAPTSANSRTGPRRQREKRKAVKSPYNSPKSKPRTKRGAQGIRKGQVTFSAAIAKEEDGQDEHVQEENEAVHNDTPRQFLAQFPTQLDRGAPSEDFLRRNSVAHMRTNRAVVDPESQIDSQSSRMLPPLHGRSSYNMGQEELYARSTQEMLQRQLQAARSMGLDTQYPSGYGANMNPIPVMSNSRTSPNLGQNGRMLPQQGGLLLPSFSETSKPEGLRPSDQVDGTGHSLGGANVHGSRFSSRQPSIFEDHLRLSAPSSRVPSRQPSVAEGLSHPGSRVSSRQPSRQSSAENLHLSLNSNAAGQSEDDHRIVKLAMPRDWKAKLTASPSAQAPDVANPTIRLRIHSNSYDSNGSPIFSILTMRMHDTFGPRLDYYCTQRGKRYGHDWKIVFRYPAPTRSNPDAYKYFDLTYTMTPALCRDKAYPGGALRNNDTIIVVTRRDSAGPSDSEDTELITQIECQRIDIQNGETRVWQAPNVNYEWYRAADKALIMQRNQLGMQHNELVRLRQGTILRDNAIADLQTQNAQMQQEIGRLRQGGLPYRGNQHVGRVSLPPTMPAQHAFGQGQQRSGFPLGSLAEYMQGGPVGGRQGLVHGAADQVGAKEQEQE